MFDIGKGTREPGSVKRRQVAAGLVSMALTVSMAVPVYGISIAAADEANLRSSSISVQKYSLDEQIHYMKELLKRDTSSIKDKKALLSVLTEIEFTEQGMKELEPDCFAAFKEDARSEIKRLQRILGVVDATDPGVQSQASATTGSAKDETTASSSDAANPSPSTTDESGSSKAQDISSSDSKTSSSSKKASSNQAADASVAKKEKQADKPAIIYPQWTYAGSRAMTAHKSVDRVQREFIALYGEHARAIAQESGLYASVMLAQAILESQSGASDLASAPYNNLFRMKASDSAEGAALSLVSVDSDDASRMSASAFAAYESTYDSMEDYAGYLSDRGAELFHGALKSEAKDCYAACDWLQGRYSSDEDYAEQLKKIIRTHELEKYDGPLDYELADEYLLPVRGEDGVPLVDEKTGTPITELRSLLDLQEELASHLGDKYVWGGTQPGSFDCSGLAQYSFKSALGVSLPRTSFYQCLVGEDVDFKDLHAGDIVFFTDSLGVCNHVGIYMGEGCYIEASGKDRVVKLTAMEEKMPAFAKRVLKVKAVEKKADAEETDDSSEPEQIVPSLEQAEDTVARKSSSLIPNITLSNSQRTTSMGALPALPLTKTQ